MLKTHEKNKLRQLVSLENERMVEIFDALSDSTRCKLFRLFVHHPGLNVGEAASTLKVSMPLASQHLKILETAGLLKRHKEGRHVFYRLNKSDRHIELILKVID